MALKRQDLSQSDGLPYYRLDFKNSRVFDVITGLRVPVAGWGGLLEATHEIRVDTLILRIAGELADISDANGGVTRHAPETRKICRSRLATPPPA
jgi:hypothetical protein